MMRVLLVALCAALAGTGLTFAQSRFAGSDDRYVATQVEGGVLRIDRQSGAVSLCTRAGGDWICELVPDDREAMLAEIEQLRRDNRQLRRRLASADPTFRERDRNREIRPGVDPDDGRLTREEIDETMDSFEYMMERLLGAADRFGLSERPPR
jgi:hypothetical protein